MFNKDEYYRTQTKISILLEMLIKYKTGTLQSYIDYDSTYNLYKAEYSYLSYLADNTRKMGIKL